LNCEESCARDKSIERSKIELYERVPRMTCSKCRGIFVNVIDILCIKRIGHEFAYAFNARVMTHMH